MELTLFYTGVLVPSFIILPILVALYKIKIWKAPERLSFFYLLLSGVFNIVSYITAKNDVNNLSLLHLYTVLEFWLLSAFFRSVFTSLRLKKVITVAMVIFPVLAGVYILLTDSLMSYNPLPRFLGGLILASYCVYFLFQDLNRLDQDHSMFSFTVVVGLLLYFSSSLILFALPELIREDLALNSLIWIIYATFVLLMYVCFGIAFIKLKKQ